MRETLCKPQILLSEGSSNSARQALYGLGRRNTIDVVDPSPWCQCRFSSLVRKRIACPRIATDPIGYVRFISDLVQRSRYDVLFPTHEQVYVFAKFRDMLAAHVGLAVPSFEAIQRLQSKSEFSQLMQELDLPTPSFRIFDTRSGLASYDEFPCFVKLVHSTASLGVQKVQTAADLFQSITQFEQAGLWTEGDPIVIQQPARGHQAEASALFQEGRLVGIACANVLKTGIGGGPAIRQSALHRPVAAHMQRLGRYLNWSGPISLEYFYDSDAEEPSYIEANPRIGETLNAQISGVNLCEATVRVALGEHVERLPDARPGVLSHNGFIVLIADAYNGATRRELLRELLNYWMKRSVYGRCESDMTRWSDDRLSIIPATAVIARLLCSPRSANSLARSTVDNYSLPQSAAKVIDQLPDDFLNQSVQPI